MNFNKNIFVEQQLLAIRLLDIYNPKTKIGINTPTATTVKYN